MAFDPTIGRILGIESGGDANATNPNSSATGAGQFINSTWLDTIGKYRPDLTEGKSQQEILDLRKDPNLSAEMTANYARQNAATLTNAGQPVTPGTTYLAHFAGPQGAVKVLGAPENMPVSQILGIGVVKANPFLANMTAADLRNWADRKMGGSTPSGGMQNNAPAASPVAPVSPQPIQNMPAPPLGAPQAPAQQPPAQGIPPNQTQAPPLGGAPIQYAQRRAPNLTGLNALLANAPASIRGLLFRG